MCFSASASFIASAVLAIVGVASIRKVTQAPQIIFTSIPVIFSMQQFTEGFVWLTLTDSNMAPWQNVPIYLFVIIAQVIWPVWVPLSFWLIEKEKKRKKILAVFLMIGIGISVYLAYCIWVYDISARISPYHIHYELAFPHEYLPLLAGFYLFPTLLSPFFSSLKWTSLLGTLILMSFLISKLFFNDYVISVWCFFGALASALIYVIIKQLNTKRRIM